MDKIYSRKRIKLPKFVFKKFNISNSKNSKKMGKFILIITIATMTFTACINSITPIFETCVKIRQKVSLQ